MVYTATFTPVGDGAVSIDVLGGVYTDASANGNTAATQFNWTYDGTGPTMVITAAEGTDPFSSNDAALSLTFTSSETTTNFAVGDISVTNGSLSGFSGSGIVYTATFTPTGQGTATIDVAGSTFTDAVGNNNTAATQFNWTFDSTVPTMIITAAEGSDGFTSSNATLSLTFTSSEATTNFSVGDISVTNGSLSGFSGSGSVYTATFTPAVNGAVTIDVAGGVYTDAAANGNTTADQFNWTFINEWTSNGSNSTAWSTAGNWTGGVPVSSSILLIPTTPSGGTGYPAISTTATITKMTIESSASFTISSGIFTVTGDLSNSGTVNSQGDLNINGTLTLASGTVIMNSGSNLIAGTTVKTSGATRFERTLTGSPGWRLLSAPAASTYGDFLDKIYVQWSTGTGADTLSPSVLSYLETYAGTDNQRWRKPAGSGTSLSAGKGLFVYAFGSTADPLYNISFPVTLDVDGSEIVTGGTEFDFGVTYTTTADSGWNLVGNPFAATIDWDGSWTKTNVDGSIYVWDPSASSYKTWNGTAGTLGDGIIAPFQGFWVKANAAVPSLIVNYSAKTQGNSFIGKAAEPAPNFYISAGTGDFKEKIFFMFSEEGRLGKDPYDTYWLTPPIQSYLEFNAVREGGDRMVVQNLPLEFGIPLEIPIRLNLILNDNQSAADFEINWGDLSSLPEGWTLSLMNNTTGESIDLLREAGASLSKIGDQKSVLGKTDNSQIFMPSTRAKFTGNSDYTLIIDPGYSFPDIPREFSLDQNYPNPFNAQTNFSFLLPIESRVSFYIYDLLGRKIDTLVDGRIMPAGRHKINWNAHELPTGVYFSQMILRNKVYTRKFMVVK